MAYKCYEMTYSRALDDHIKKFICDAASDVANLPEAAPMSTAIVAENGNVYIVNASGAWVSFG